MQHPYPGLRMTMASAQGTSSACAACRVLRRKCTAQCLFAPYFPPDQPQKFAHVHKVTHLQAQLALATSEITRLRETFAIAAAAAPPGARLVAALLPCSSPNSTHAAENSNSSAAVNPDIAMSSPQPQQQLSVPTCAMPGQQAQYSPTPCERSPAAAPAALTHTTPVEFDPETQK